MKTNEFIAKIEGHGSLKVDWDRGEVKLNISEGERLFEGLLVGRTAEEMHWITPRICGVCPVAHNLASLKALEAALAIIPNWTTLLLRDLMQCGQMVQSHTLHLFFLSLPDYLGIDRGTELAVKNPAVFKSALFLKEISDEIVQTVAGRNVHPTTTTIGGFHKIPSKSKLKKLLEKIKNNGEAAGKTIDLCFGLDYPELKVDLELAAIDGDKIRSVNSLKMSHSEQVIRFAQDKLRTPQNTGDNGNGCFQRDSSSADWRTQNDTDISDYKKDIEEEIRDYSTAKFARYKKKEVLVGALARLAIGESRAALSSTGFFARLRRAQNDRGVDFANPYHNNLAQAIEIAYYLRKAEDLIDKLLNMEMDKNIVQPSKNPSLKGIGAIEAPRGGLYHEIHLNPSTGSGNNNSPSTGSARSGHNPSTGSENNIITYANIITPTVQNLTSIEKSAKALLEQQKNRSREELERLLTMLVRAYDSCITCAVH